VYSRFVLLNKIDIIVIWGPAFSQPAQYFSHISIAFLCKRDGLTVFSFLEITSIHCCKDTANQKVNFGTNRVISVWSPTVFRLLSFEKCVHKMRQASIIVFTSPSNEKLQQNCKTRLYVRKIEMLHTVKIIAVRCQVTTKYTSFTLLSETCVNPGRASVMASLNCVRKVLRLGQYLWRAIPIKVCHNFLHVFIWPTDGQKLRDGASVKLLSQSSTRFCNSP
jgi:hypothetical protein